MGSRVAKFGKVENSAERDSLLKCKGEVKRGFVMFIIYSFLLALCDYSMAVDAATFCLFLAKYDLVREGKRQNEGRF